MAKIKVEAEGYGLFEIEQGMTVAEFAGKVLPAGHCQVIAARVNRKPFFLNDKLTEDSRITFLDMTTDIGHKIYERSLCFLFVRAVAELYPGKNARVEFSLDKGLYCSIPDVILNPAEVREIEEKMEELVLLDEKFEELNVTKEEAIEIFAEAGYRDKLGMLQYLYTTKGVIYRYGGISEFFYGPVLPSAGYLKNFSLLCHSPGLILRLPTKNNPCGVPEFRPQPKLFKVFLEYQNLAANFSIDNVYSLNNRINGGNMDILIEMAEAYHERKIAEIAAKVREESPEKRIVLISGPSSSGKTTFAHRLRIQMMTSGQKPVTVSMDDFFRNRSETPRDENGDYDFESIGALDCELFNEKLIDLIAGKKVYMPKFDFESGERIDDLIPVQIDSAQPVLVEGIHGLNERLTYGIPEEKKCKIYVSALTQLNIDNHNRIPTTDTRKIRRLVRDHTFRGISATETLSMWPSVRRGEEKWIFPFQEQADVIFNSALVYELAVLRPYAERLLRTIRPEDINYLEANRLLNFLNYFLPIMKEETMIPNNSILREFIGRLYNF